MKDERNIKKVLISGISGSGGSYLAEYILQNHPTVTIHGIARWHSTTTTNNLEKIKDRIFVHECDLNDLSSVFRTLREVKPDAIFHLAAHANVKASFDTPNSVLSNNILGTRQKSIINESKKRGKMVLSEISRDKFPPKGELLFILTFNAASTSEESICCDVD